jgi:hypothetical protein
VRGPLAFRHRGWRPHDRACARELVHPMIGRRPSV